MWKSFSKFGIVAAAALLVTGLTASVSQAQARVLPNSQAIINPYYRLPNGVPINQAAYNLQVLGNAYASVPPWVYGYNPYPPRVYVQPVAPIYPSIYPYYYGTYPYGYYPYANFTRFYP